MIVIVSRNKRMWITTNYLIANMAASDLLISAFAVPRELTEICIGLRSRIGRKERGKKKEGVGEGKKAGREGAGESLLTKYCSRHSAPV